MGVLLASRISRSLSCSPLICFPLTPSGPTLAPPESSLRKKRTSKNGYWYSTLVIFGRSFGHFGGPLWQCLPEACPRRPQGAPKASQGVPKSCQRRPKVPKASPRRPKGFPRRPQVVPKAPQSPEGVPKASKGVPEAPQGDEVLQARGEFPKVEEGPTQAQL